jgi:Holliday junction resolvase RusA-like endonuclease
MPGLNEMNWEDRCGFRRGSRFKKKITREVAQWAMVNRVPKYKCPVQVHIRFFEPNRRRDRDNIKGAVKYIMDGLKLRGVIVNDSQKWVTNQTEEILLDKQRPRVEVTIMGGT